MDDVTQNFDVLERRYSDSNRVLEAVRTQDELRQRSGDWSGEREVKRWRSGRSP